VGIKIALGAKALGALVKDDEEVRLELLRGAISLFARRYLKEVVATEAFREEVARVGEEVREQLRRDYPAWVRVGGGVEWQVTDSMRGLQELVGTWVEAAVKSQVGRSHRDLLDRLETLQKNVETQIAGRIAELSGRLGELVDTRVRAHLNHAIDKEVRRRLKELGVTQEDSG